MRQLLAKGFIPTCAVFLAGWGAVPRARAAAVPSLPTPPPNAAVFNQVQNTTDNWMACSICAGGTNDTTNYWMAPFESRPSMTGSSRELYIGGPPWSNALFIKKFPGNTWASHFLWDFWVYWDATSAANIWSAEFDFWQAFGGHELMIGSQCDFGDGYWSTWDELHNRWVPTTIACPRFAPGTWHHIQWYMERWGTNQYHYGTLVVDGRGYDINQAYWGVNAGWDDGIGIQWQLDQDGGGHDLHEWIDNVKLTIW